jgi:transposase
MSLEMKRQAVLHAHLAGDRPSEIFLRMRHMNLSKLFILRTIRRYSETGSLNDRPRSGRPPQVKTARNRKVIASRLRRNPRRSLRKMAAQLQLGRESVRQIVKSDLGLHPYKLQQVAELSPSAAHTRLVLCKGLLERFALSGPNHIVFSDEKVFTIEQVFNHQNDRIWASSASAIPPAARMVTHSQSPPSLMVWAAVTADGRTPLVFLPPKVKINALLYQSLILDAVLLPWARSHFINRQWVFLQDSAPSHRAKSTIQWLHEHNVQFITPQQWPPYSPDLNVMDYCVWGILESRVCTQRHASLASLKHTLQREWELLPEEMLRAAVSSFTARLKTCIHVKGQRFEPFSA